MTCSNCVTPKQPDEYSLSVRQSVCSTVRLFVSLFVSLSVRQFVSLSVRQSVCSSKTDKFV